MRWQKRARFVAASVGIASAIGVYAVMGERAQPVPAVAPDRLDPKAVIESRGNILQQVRGTRQDFLIEAEQQLTYEGGATKLLGIKVSVKNRSGRDYVITAKEALAGERQAELRLTGDVVLEANDGFRITTSEAFFSEKDGNVRAPEAFRFERGKMSGGGVGMTYDKNNDVLAIQQNAEVTFAGEEEGTTAFTAGSAVFTRVEHLLTLAGAVHVIHLEQVIDADQATAHLTDDDSRVSLLELRGNAAVSGSGQGLEAMTASAIDIHYAEDGETIQRLLLSGQGRVAMKGDGGSRDLAGETLEIDLAADGSPTRMVGQGGVRLDLGTTPQAAARAITARAVTTSGESGKGLTAARFEENVEFREGTGADARLARSAVLEITMADDAIQSAVFTGNARFEQAGLQGSGGRAVYQPDRDSLQLRSGTGEGMSRLVDERVTVEAVSIDVTLGARRMTATESVKTTLRPQRDTGRDAAPATAAGGRLPGLLEDGEPANVNADSFRYQGAAGTAVYEGNATLFQGDTAIRARQITLDQENGDLVAAGDARSTMRLDTGTSNGRADRITYTDAKRVVTLLGIAAPPTRPAAAPPAATPASSAAASGARAPVAPAVPAHLSGPHGELRANEIQIVLAAGGGKAERLEAYRDVELALDDRRARGARLTYFSSEERYLMTGTGVAPVKVAEKCREISGRTLTFFKASDRIIVDGNEEIRTQTTNAAPAATGGPCAQPPLPR